MFYCQAALLGKQSLLFFHYSSLRRSLADIIQCIYHGCIRCFLFLSPTSSFHLFSPAHAIIIHRPAVLLSSPARNRIPHCRHQVTSLPVHVYSMACASPGTMDDFRPLLTSAAGRIGRLLLCNICYDNFSRWMGADSTVTKGRKTNDVFDPTRPAEPINLSTTIRGLVEN